MSFTGSSRERYVALVAYMGANQLLLFPLVLHVVQDCFFLYGSNGFAKVPASPHG